MKFDPTNVKIKWHCKPFALELAKNLLKFLNKKPSSINAMRVVSFILEMKNGD